MSNTRFYRIFAGINARCNTKSSGAYRHYGKNGIKCLWKSFEDFRDDMYKSYLKHCKKYGEKETTIDRKNSGGNYCKENCRWATYREQSYNSSRPRFLIHNGIKLSVSDWARKTGIKRKTLSQRINKYKWSVEKALVK